MNNKCILCLLQQYQALIIFGDCDYYYLFILVTLGVSGLLVTLSSFDLPRFPQARKKEVLSASPNATSRSKNSPISAASWRGLVGRSDPGQGNKRKAAITVTIIIFFFLNCARLFTWWHQRGNTEVEGISQNDENVALF